MPNDKRSSFESDTFLVRIDSDHLFYAEKAEVLFDFRNIAKLRIHRRRGDGKISKITYRVKGRVVPFQIDGSADSDMKSMADLLKARARDFSIPVSDREVEE